MESWTRQQREEIIRFLNPAALLPHLTSHELIYLEDVEFLLNHSVTTRNKNKWLLSLLETRGPQAYTHFLDCLDSEHDHLGHLYITALLQGRTFGDEKEVCISHRLQRKINKYMPDLVQGMNVQCLTPYLRSKALLTTSEQESLTNPYKTEHDKVLHLLNVLNSKGPTAHFIFARCLMEETEHPTHWELFQKITEEEDLASFKLQAPSRKRKRENELCNIPVTKRLPDRLKARGTLVSRKYYEYMTEIRRYHLRGQWEEADRVVKECLEMGDTELHIAVTLENCTGYITRRDTHKVLLEVGGALKLCQLGLLSDNWSFLRGRCEWVLAKLYRYTREMDKALEHIQESAEHQSGIESGEDAALTNYCHACILLERINNPDHHSSHSEDRRNAKNFLERAIEYASKKEYGLDLSHPRICLAQLYLGSSPSRPGGNQDPDNISKARASLQAVELDALEPRTECIFYFTKSDLMYSSGGGRDEARCLAQRAMDIATRNSFKTEILSAQARLDRIGTE